MVPFEPFVRNNHLLTIAGNFWPRNFRHNVFPGRAQLLRTESDVQILAYVQDPRDEPQGDVILLHGLEGSHLSGYMVSMAQAGLEAGFRVTRLNTRTCGDSEQHCRTLYHAGLTVDLAAVVEAYRKEDKSRPIFVVGYSLGGNVALKFAGESGARLAGTIAGVAAVSTPIDLAACCREMRRPWNRLYERRFLDRLKARYRRRCADHPDLYREDGIETVRSVYEFDDRYTAPAFGFGTADRYYETQSSQNFLDGVAVPALMIQAKDDPLVPFSVFSHPALQANPNIELVATDHGGHVGFISRRRPRFWADLVICEWMLQQRNKVRDAHVFR